MVGIYFSGTGNSKYAVELFCKEYYLIKKERGEKYRMGVKNIVSMLTYVLAAVLGILLPIAAYIVVFGISAWWIFPALLFRKDRHDKH